MAYLKTLPIPQGEVEFFAVTDDHFDNASFGAPELSGDYVIIGHSESGHHHVLDRAKCEVATVLNDSEGMRVLRVLVTDPAAEIVNLKPNGHRARHVPPGLYEVRISREMGLDDIVRVSSD